MAASASLEFRILGRIEVRRGDELLPLGGTKQRTLLALLLVHANEIVARDRIIDELWGESPPPTVATALNVHVSRLRRALANACPDKVLVTTPPGYTLRVPSECIDACRFERLVDEGRGELADGKLGRAARTLTDALSLWRGRPLADVDHAPFAQRERDRLEELRLAALEDSVEAELALGRHRTVIPQLEVLLAEHPYRERLAAQLMVALYRSGRQAEALATYQRLRRALAGELGLVPSRALEELEARILRHDRSLDAAAEDREAAPRRRLRGRGARVLLAAATAALISGLTSEPRGIHDAYAAIGNSIVVIDPATNDVVGEVPVGGRPSGVATGAGAVWVINRDDETLLKIDPHTRKVVGTIGLGVEPRGVAVGAGSVWVRTLYGSLLRFDPLTGARVARIEAPRGPQLDVSGSLAFGGGAVWSLSEGRLVRLATRTSKPVLTPKRDVLGWGRVAYAQGSVWLGRPGTLLRLDPHSLAVRARISLADIGLRGCVSLFVGMRDVWIADLQFHTVARIDAATGSVRAVIPLSSSPWDLAAGGGAVWAVQSDGTISRIDRATSRVERTIRLGVYPAAYASPTIAIGAGAVWVATTSF